MKNIFKKNQIIITALAIMIAIAGYLSFTNNDTTEEASNMETANSDSEGYDEYTEEDGLDLVTNTTTDTTDTDTTDTTDTDTTDTTDTDTTDTTDTTTDDTDAATTGINDDEETTPVKTLEDVDELGDISDEDLLESAQNVADNGELDLEEGVPGEAVLASAALDAGYFISSKLDREQVRAKNKETLMDLIENTEITQEAKKDAINSYIEITDIAEKENAAEMLLEAKGFDGAIVFISDGDADVVVNAETLSDQQLAIIENVVKKKTDIAAEHISINPVVVSE